MPSLSNRWRWVAHGKHPALSDYISAGRIFPMATGISNWVHNGFSEQQKLNSPRRFRCSWRFWVKGNSRDDISCGLLTDSCDSVGRPYPLLIMGNGPLAGWERHWELVPAVCESAWGGMEECATTPYRDFTALDRGVASLPQPSPHWDAFRTVGDDDLAELEATDGASFNLQLRDLLIKNFGYIFLDRCNVCDRLFRTEYAGKILSRNLKNVPTAVFVGGTAEATWFAFYCRPLTGADFAALWTRLPQRLLKDNR